jgi:WD40 repeat protein
MFSSQQQVPKSVTVVAKAGPLQGVTAYTDSYALFVGIGKYDNQRIPLIPSAPNDATTLKNLLTTGFGFNPSNVEVLIDAQATKENIDRAIAKLCDKKIVKPTDRVLVFFSCHGQGVPLPNGKEIGYILPYNAKVDLNDLENVAGFQTSCLKMDELADRLEASPARHRAMIIDACFSGFSTGSKALGTAKFAPEALKKLLDERGLFIMTAGSSKEEAAGSRSAQGLSLYTQSLVNALKEAQIQSGTYTAAQLFDESARTTLNLSKGKQNPQSALKDGVGQMLFFTVGGIATSTNNAIASALPTAGIPLSIAIFKIDCNVPDAKIEANGQIIPTSVSFDLGPGSSKKLTVKVSAQYYKTEFFEVTLNSGQAKVLNVELKKRISGNKLDYATLEPLQTLNSHESHVMCVAYSPNGLNIASASADKTIKIWNAQTGELEKTLRDHSGVVFYLAFSPSGNELASVSDDRTVKVWDTSKWSIKYTLKGHTSYLYSVAYSPDGKLLASGGFDNTIKIWDTNSYLNVATLIGHSAPIWALAFSQDSRTLWSGSADKSIKLWNMKSYSLKSTLLGHTGTIRQLISSSKGNLFASASFDSKIKLWSTIDSSNKVTFDGSGKEFYAVCFSADGDTLITGDSKNLIQIWDIKEERLSKTIKGHGIFGVNSFALSPDGKILASAGGDGTVKLWRVNDED